MKLTLEDSLCVKIIVINMDSNIGKDKVCYLEKIKKELITKYKLNDVNALEKLRQYDYLSEIIEYYEDYFFYQSPEYWADYLME